jgi:hypothetical protein
MTEWTLWLALSAAARAWIPALGDDDPRVRARAAAILTRIGPPAAPGLRQAKSEHPDPEVRHTVERLLEILTSQRILGPRIGREFALVPPGEPRVNVLVRNQKTLEGRDLSEASREWLATRIDPSIRPKPPPPPHAEPLVDSFPLSAEPSLGDLIYEFTGDRPSRIFGPQRRTLESPWEKID